MGEYYEYRVCALFDYNHPQTVSDEQLMEVTTQWTMDRDRAIAEAESLREKGSGNVTVETRLRGDYGDFEELPESLGEHSDPHPHAGGGSR
ncbi:hypothetical protein ACFQJ7_13845 [Halovenus rubra]|uniref:Uncharacterized protein n=2 Tax=Halovenus rubra TaxID=869890 RepID=A0ACC7DZS3_9EURY|nr:hypothetical protein [Halovenus rubra]